MQRAPASFSSLLLAWHTKHGRAGLPWQACIDPYRVWLSEIMLQQTQVVTVIDYYRRFLEKYPTVIDLAAAPQDQVMALWAGLGYYSRARNLHACAQTVAGEHGGVFPKTAKSLQMLPGIGPSTAAAIAAFCYAERVPILDGNVKRVLTRVHAFADDLSKNANEARLWQIAADALPRTRLASTMPRYTQAIMDLGATVCTPRQPACVKCPMASICQAKALGRVMDFPVKSKKLKRSSESLWLLLARRDDDSVLLQKRPAPGVWAGLHCLPLFGSHEALDQALRPKDRAHLHPLPAFVHVLTHKDLHLHVLQIDVKGSAPYDALGAWHQDLSGVGLPAPIKKLLAA